MNYAFQLKTVTEMFVGGADNSKADLCPSSFRGPLRFWFRAMMGQIVGNDLDALHKLESAAFGATDQASPFRLRISGEPRKRAIQNNKPSPGYAYLAFPFYGNNQQLRECILPGEKFTLEFCFRRPDSLLEKLVLSSFWLLAHFGGIGSRTRRGFGAFCVESSTQVPGLPFQSTAAATHYRGALQAFAVTFKRFAVRVLGNDPIAHFIPGFPEYSCLALWEGRILSCDEWTTQNLMQKQGLLDEVGRMWRGFRNDDLQAVQPRHMTAEDMRNIKTGDYQDVISGYMNTGRIASDDLINDALGLPIILNSSTRKPRGDYQTTVYWLDKENKKRDRRGSPFCFHPIQLNNGNMAALIFCFVADFLPHDAAEEMVCPIHRAVSVRVADAQDIQSAADVLFPLLDKYYIPQNRRSIEALP